MLSFTYIFILSLAQNHSSNISVSNNETYYNLFFNIFHRNKFLRYIHLRETKTMILVLKFSSLIINRIDAEPFFLRHKFFLDFRVGWHTENIQITKVIVPTLFVSFTPCTATKGKICKYPSIRCYIELCPIMASRIILRHI